MTPGLTSQISNPAGRIASRSVKFSERMQHSLPISLSHGSHKPLSRRSYQSRKIAAAPHSATRLFWLRLARWRVLCLSHSRSRRDPHASSARFPFHPQRRTVRECAARSVVSHRRPAVQSSGECESRSSFCGTQVRPCRTYPPLSFVPPKMVTTSDPPPAAVQRPRVSENRRVSQKVDLFFFRKISKLVF